MAEADPVEAEAESESLQLAMKDALITETLGELVKLRRQVDELGPVLTETINKHAEIGTVMLDQQREHFAAMAAAEIQKLNASYSAEADKALSSAARSLTKAAESLDSSKADVNGITTVIWSAAIGGFAGLLVFCGMFLFSR